MVVEFLKLWRFVGSDLSGWLWYHEAMVKLHTVLRECCDAPDTVSTLKKIIYTNQEMIMKLMVWKILD